MAEQSGNPVFDFLTNYAGESQGVHVRISDGDRSYIVCWKPTDTWYGKVRFQNASISMPEAKLNFLRKKYDLNDSVIKFWNTHAR